MQAMMMARIIKPITYYIDLCMCRCDTAPRMIFLPRITWLPLKSTYYMSTVSTYNLEFWGTIPRITRVEGFAQYGYLFQLEANASFADQQGSAPSTPNHD